MKVVPGLTIVAMAALAISCDDPRRAEMPARKAGSGAAAPAPTNRIELPETVRQNLGITFARVEQRRVASTLRVPGRFELLPTARREYRAALPGFVRLLVAQYEQVDKGKPIFRMDSPEWHRIKRELHESEVGIERATAELLVAQHAKTEAEQIVQAMQKRVEALANAEVRRAELETELAVRRAAVPRLEAEIKVKEAALDEAKHDLQLNIDKAASLLGVTPQFMRETDKSDGGHETQRWYSINHIGLNAPDSGTIEAIAVADGAWVEANTLIATSIDLSAVRFRAVGLQSDLGKLRDGLMATVLPPHGASNGSATAVQGKLQLGPVADPDQRTVDLIVIPEKLTEWARPGVSSLLEIVTDASADAELAIPASAVVQDELTHVYFRRDPNDPNKVIRTEADLGVNDGKWVVVRSGVKEGDEVVLDGVYELKLSGGGGQAGGGHFHADGTWHAEPDK
jgi:multidrug efflux pump subunit AcrA (membrane-fusion protein)